MLHTQRRRANGRAGAAHGERKRLRRGIRAERHQRGQRHRRR
jgi:hypothetical protein